VLGHAPSTVDTLNHYLDLNTALINGVRPSLPNLLTAVVEGESVVGGTDANGHYVRVLALSGACTFGPDPTGACSTPGTSGSSVPTPGAAPSTGAPSRESFPRQTAYNPLTDDQLIALFLGS
jgi:hypothetical protein